MITYERVHYLFDKYPNIIYTPRSLRIHTKTLVTFKTILCTIFFSFAGVSIRQYPTKLQSYSIFPSDGNVTSTGIDKVSEKFGSPHESNAPVSMTDVGWHFFSGNSVHHVCDLLHFSPLSVFKYMISPPTYLESEPGL